jgi:hypothetical protein
MISNSSDLFTNTSASSETGSIIRPILRNRPTNTSNLNISQSANINSNYQNVTEMDTNSMRLNLLKVDMYPDPYRHITTTILEYPESKANNKRSEDKEAKLKNEKAKRMNRRNNLRYMTQPVTLIEIKEIEEDAVFNTNNNNNNNNTLINDADNNINKTTPYHQSTTSSEIKS